MSGEEPTHRYRPSHPEMGESQCLECGRASNAWCHEEVPSPEEQTRELLDSIARKSGDLHAPAAAATGIELGYARNEQTHQPMGVVLRLTIVLPKAEAEQLAVNLASHAAAITPLEIATELPPDLRRPT